MNNKTQSRKWQITINNPDTHGFSHDKIKELLATKNPLYYCMSDEIGLEKKTYHTHVFVVFSCGVRLSTMLKLFPNMHFELCSGTSAQNRDYVFKEGPKYGPEGTKSDKADTKVAGTQEEFGELPVERQGNRTDLEDLYDMIKAGMSDADIIDSNPKFLFNIDKFDKVRQTLLYQKFGVKDREVSVAYYCGVPGAGKTRAIKDLHGAENVYVVMDFKHPFDDYKGQDVIVFDDYRSQLDISLMLHIIDRYAVNLPCRYNNKVACFTKVYFTSNWNLEDQYVNIQSDSPSTWHAFLRRIHKIKIFHSDVLTEEIDYNYKEDVIPRFVEPVYKSLQKSKKNSASAKDTVIDNIKNVSNDGLDTYDKDAINKLS